MSNLNDENRMDQPFLDTKELQVHNINNSLQASQVSTNLKSSMASIGQ